MNNNPIINFSLDIESLGTKPGSVVTEIGICNDYSADELHLYFNVDYQKDMGLSTDPSTLEWHAEKNPNFDVMQIQCAEQPDTVAHFIQTLQKIEDYFKQFAEHPHAVWMNSPSFDSVLLQASVFHPRIGIKLPWSYRAERDLRTLRMIAQLDNDHSNMPAKPDNAHDALVDAKWQLEIVKVGLDHIRVEPF